MSTRLRLRRKQYNSLTDSGSGIVVFDYTTKKIHVSGDEFYPIFQSGISPRSGVVPAPRSTSNIVIPKIISETGWTDLTSINYSNNIEINASTTSGAISLSGQVVSQGGSYTNITGGVVSLEITDSIVSSPWESFIKFQTAFDAEDPTVGAFDVVLPEGTLYAGNLSCEPGTLYLISMLKGMFVMHSMQIYSQQS